MRRACGSADRKPINKSYDPISLHRPLLRCRWYQHGREAARLHGEQVAKVIACVNHDANAIASHAANHPDALHFVEDIRTLNLDRLLAHVEVSRNNTPPPAWCCGHRWNAPTSRSPKEAKAATQTAARWPSTFSATSTRCAPTISKSKMSRSS